MSATTLVVSKVRPQALNNLSRLELLMGGICPGADGRAVQRAEWIDKGDQLAAAQDKLVEQILRLVGDRFRMNHDQDLDVVRDFVGGDFDLS